MRARDGAIRVHGGPYPCVHACERYCGVGGTCRIWPLSKFALEYGGDRGGYVDNNLQRTLTVRLPGVPV